MKKTTKKIQRHLKKRGIVLSSSKILVRKLLLYARMIMSSKPSGLPAIGKYHNNLVPMDAYVSRKYQKEFDSKCKYENTRRGVPVVDYYGALRNLSAIFLMASPGHLEKGRSDSYDVRHFTTESVINKTVYEIKVKVLVPTEMQIKRIKTPSQDNGESHCKIKWIYMTKKNK